MLFMAYELAWEVHLSAAVREGSDPCAGRFSSLDVLGRAGRGLLALAAFFMPLTMDGQTIDGSHLLQQRASVSLFHSRQGH